MSGQMDVDDDDDDNFDLIQPSLLQQIRKILDQYPDDGQILKELIQNAEDAGARQVKFLYDKHSYGTERLFSDSLAEFQGPALYAYNDAQFKKDDWEGIRMLCESKKVKDPMKVGRFGLGFKSVFHMTDLPSILSNKQIGFIDPHEKHFIISDPQDERPRPRTGFNWRLNKQQENLSDQFLPFKGIFDCNDDVFSRGSYKGTLFRFPLRNAPSELSNTLYSEEKMQSLFDSFITDAYLVLLFLQNLESISIYTREKCESQPRKLFQAQISSASLKSVRNKREEFYAKIKSDEHVQQPVTVTYPITIEVETESSTQKHSFLVTSYCCGSEVSADFEKLLTDDELSYLPSVGVAMALPPSIDHPTPDIEGQVFCVLPLPVQKKSTTGLPVHVNGFFALNQNRHYIKTPNADQDGRGKLTDKSLSWNRCLMEEAVPKAYALMIREAIDNFNVQPEAVYKAWPDVDSIAQAWKGLQDPLFKFLCSENVVNTKAQGGKWLKVEEAIFDRLPESESKELLLKVLLEAHRNVASLPDHVLHSIRKYKQETTDITPSLVRWVLKDSPDCYRHLHLVEKLLLLKFVLKCEDNNFAELIGLELLPTAIGTFTSFSHPGENIYICSREHPQALLPGLQHRLLDQRIEVDLLKSLEKVANQGSTQLRRLCKDDVPTLLRESLPSAWFSDGNVEWFPGDEKEKHPPKDWLISVWDYLRVQFEEDLCEFENLPLIPLDFSQVPVTLTRITKPSKVVVRKLNKDRLDSAVCEVLKALGVTVMKDCPIFLRSHPAVLETFVHQPSVQGVLTAMAASSSTMGDGMHSAILLEKISRDSKRSLRKFIAKASSLTPEEKEYLLNLPLFETLKGNFVSKKEGLGAAPEDALPVTPSRDVIDIQDQDSKNMVRLLDIRIPTLTEFLCAEMFPDVKKGGYSIDEIDRLVAFVMERYQFHVGADTRFEEEMRSLPFVTTNSSRVRALDLFDPREGILQGIFADEDVFPAGEQYTDSTVLVVLKKLGMKSREEITAEDLYQSAKKISCIPNYSRAKWKSETIMSYLDSNPMKLQETVSDGTALELRLRDIRWVSALINKPQGFPGSLYLCGATAQETQFYKPTEVTSKDHINLIGTVKPIVKVDASSQLAKYFGWDKMPDSTDVVKQLKTVTSHYTQDEKPQYIAIVKAIYSFLSDAEDADVKMAMQGIENSRWIWNGDGFSCSNAILAKSSSVVLSPYICSLPTEVLHFSSFLRKFGMREHCDASFFLQVLQMIKQKYEPRGIFPPSEVKKDLQLCVNILNEIKPNVGEQLPPELQKKVLIPTHVEGDSYVKLAPVEDCMYCEHEWLENGNHNEDMDFLYVHPNIANSTAELLQVRTLTNRLLEPEEMQIGDEFGQAEKLTHRLKRLLEEYTDGFSVLKELIQNADDAGATEVRFLYDERTNKDAMTCLIDEGMRECQGPALWVYNDAKFRDEDFANITKLNGGTKEQENEKIGKFGLGFNAVYNVTDVPMFLSRNYFVIFDPNTFYLGKAIRNKSKPGMKIDINKNTKRLRNFKNQFKPFNGIFGCDLHLDKEDNSFNGTLFRFPLRTREQAAKSEIKELYYSGQEMQQLFQIFLGRAELLLLFTQNVIRIEIYHLPSSSVNKPEPELMFQVTKSLSEDGIRRELCVPITLPVTAKKLDSAQQKFLMQCNFLQASSRVKRNAKNRKVLLGDLLKSSFVVEVECLFTNSGTNFFKTDDTPSQQTETWLVVSSMGTGKAMEFSKNDSSLLPSAGVAVQLVRKGANAFLPSPVDVDGLGTIFCYLPLPMHCGLPVHINGAFAVTSNRRHLQERLEDDKECHGVGWNSMLMEDSITSAYISLLEDLKPIVADDGSYAFHSLWPKACKVQQDCWSILTSFYKQLLNGSLALFSDGFEWFTINQVVFLHPHLRADPEIGDVSFAVFQQYTNVKDVVIDLPDDVFQSFVCSDQCEVIKSKTYDESRFFCELFFPNISDVRSDFREVLVLYALDKNNKDFDEMMKKHPCIPVTLSGKILKCPDQLVNPTKEASALFCREDGRFPCGNDGFQKSSRLEKLEQLGMVSDELPWKDIAERAESIPRVNAVDSKAAVKRVKAWLKFVEKILKRNAENEGEGPSHPVLDRLLNAQFVPVLPKPMSFPLTWRGDDFHGTRKRLVAPKDIFLKESKYLVCCTEPLVGLEIPKKVKELLKFEDKEVTTEHVMSQLENAISINIGSFDRKGYGEVSHVCKEAYSFLQDKVISCPSYIEKFLCEKSFILVGKRFLSAKHVAFEIKIDCSPYLYRLPDVLCDDYSKIMKIAGVREKFEEKDYISSLQEVKRKFDERQLDEKTLQVAVNMAIQLGETLERSDCDTSEVEEKLGPVFLPDSRGIMRAVPDLCYKDCMWMPDDPDEQSVHEKIPQSTCAHLGVKTRRDEALQNHDAGFPFGQKEKLTNRLKRILTGYPGQKELLKELLQNADDARASEIFFIKDPRHHPDERVFRESWKPLQGPALCVYNNRPFTKKDIKGICNLGQGSKGEDPNKTGQYGVGFNAVYHLTDVPSFMSTGDEIGDVLCVFDPHCKYIPHASDAKPGRMFKGIDKLKTKFPDVFPCYLEQHFPIENATMFRFPLKTEKMAKESQISQTAVTVEKLEVMLKELKKELFEVLLFVNNVKKISISEIDEGGNLVNTYSVKVVMSQKDDKERQAFALYMKEIGKQAKQEDFLPTNIQAKKCTYTLRLRDSFGVEEEWFIVQQVGFETPAKRSIIDAFKDHQLGMLPRGGVACLLQSNRPRSLTGRKKKAYCFLPLPFETNLPVHINGHFALDHEARRNLWRDEAGGYRSDWNNALLRDVIASCYLTLLDQVRPFLQLPVGQDTATRKRTFSKNTILERLRFYEGLFPCYPVEDPHWRTLVNSVFQEMSNKKMRLIPLVKSVKTRSRCSAKGSESDKVQVAWFPPTGTGKDQTYFNNLNIEGCFSALAQRHDERDKERKRIDEESRIIRKNKFEETLLETGLNLVAFSTNVFHSFQKAEVQVRCISPSAVMEFYKTFSNADPLCNIGVIPCPVDKTPFKDQEGVIRILKYCKDDEQFLENLPGLPLLLTQDNWIRSFSKSDRPCLSQYVDILPNSPSLFVHRSARNEVFHATECKYAAVFRPLDVEIFASQLHQTLPSDFRSEDHYANWCPSNPPAILPNPRWIYRVWEFLREFTNDIMKKSDVEYDNKTAPIRDLLLPLSGWSILPATEIQIPCSLRTEQENQTVVDHLLVPLSKAESVLDCVDCGESSQKLIAALGNLGLPELNAAVLSTASIGTVPYTKQDSYEFARNLVATLKTPHSLLMVLKQKLERNPHSFDGKFKSSDATVVLDYFSRNTESLTNVDKETLRKLPFYPTATGGLAKIEDRNVFLLPEIPKNEMDVVESRLNCLFLQPRRSLLDLYEFLDVQLVSPVEVYLKFVLKCFKYLGAEGKLKHLTHLRQCILSSGSLLGKEEEEERDKKRLLDKLTIVEFIPTTDGSLKTASNFYDPNNNVFLAMLPDKSFPPEPFNSNEWLPFLTKIGLVQDVSENEFLKFAKQVALEAETQRTEKTYEKSEVLVHHLFSRLNVVDEGLLYRVRDIPFVAAHPLKESLQAVFPPFGEKKDGEIPFISFKDSVVCDYEEIVWTKAHLLPKSADPRFHRNELNYSHRKIDQYLTSLLSNLQVIRKPSIDLVVSHCQTICFHLESKNEKKDASPELSLTVTEVMEKIYQFLQDAIKEGGTKKFLQTTRCILVEKGKRFILPKQAVLDLYETHEIKPFLYKVPLEFGKFQQLFEFLGCSKYVRPTHYAMILEMLQKNCQDSKLHPNEIRTCSKAVKGFFEKLQEDDENISSLPILYLPATRPGSGSPSTLLGTISVTLHQSTELVFDDAPTYCNRIQGFQQLFVLELSKMDVSCKSTMVNYKDLMMKLPSALQPKMLSCEVKEKLSNPEKTVIVTSEAVNALKQQLSSVQFGRGIARIIRDVNSHKKDFDEGVIENIERGLRSIELCAVEDLQTSLFHNNVPIPGSEAEVPYLQQKLEVSGEEIWRVYINTISGRDDTISITSNVIVEMYGESLGRKAFVISEMLRCPLSKIWSLLDRMGIRKDDSCTAADMDIYPEPGTLIPIEDHHLLNDAFEILEPEEYVGYQLDDPSLHLKEDPSLNFKEGVATYIYAIIIEEVNTEDAVRLTKEYKINIGHDKTPAVVNSAKLYKFHRLKEIFDQQLNCNRNIKEVFDEITYLLREAWKLTEEETRQIIKRLCLRWHPEKNLGDEEFYSAAFQHIQNEVSRLGGSYDDLFAYWETRAREHGSQRKEYRERFAKKYGSWGSSSGHRSWRNVPPSFCKRNPQSGEAKRWFRQAEADLEAGANELAFSRPSYEWACFKCHQAAEKALKAAQYNKDADKIYVHNLIQNSRSLEDSELTELARQLECLVGDSTHMRYPDRMAYPKIPKDVYNAEKAERSLEIAKRIVHRVAGRLT